MIGAIALSAVRAIFVQIPSYRDSEIIPTLIDMMVNATDPEHLHTVVCWQHDEDETIDGFIDAGFSYVRLVFEHEQKVHQIAFNGYIIKLIDINYLETGGCGWARNNIQRYFADEAYSLQIDSHHRFTMGWDKTLIEMLEDLRDLSLKPILTGYPPPFDPRNDPGSRYMGAIQMDFDRFAPPGVIRFKSSPMLNSSLRDRPMRARFLSGGFVFADGSFVREVPNDCDQFFASEEISTAVRAYTHGYDLFHPHRVVLWHQYTRDDAVKVWDDHTPQRKAEGVIAQTSKDRAVSSYISCRELLGMEGGSESAYSGKFGLGNKRTLHQYERYAGLSFKFEGVEQSVLDGAEPVSEPVSMSYDEWEESLVCTIDALVNINPDDVGGVINEGCGVSVSIYATDGAIVHGFDLSDGDIEILRKNESVKYLFTFVASPLEKPAGYMVLKKPESGVFETCINKELRDDLVDLFLSTVNSS